MNHQLADHNRHVASDHGVSKLQDNDEKHNTPELLEKETAEEKTEETSIVEELTNAPHRSSMTKRTKPRRISGVEGSRVTEDSFRNMRPSLTRDDSISLIKHRVTNAVPYSVPLEAETRKPEPQPEPEQETVSRSPPRRQNSQAPQRINRRRKPRVLSGDAAVDQPRPILIRDDSLILAKKKLTSIAPITLTDADKESSSKSEAETDVTKDGDQLLQKAGSKRRLDMQEKQKRYVRQNSLSAPSA